MKIHCLLRMRQTRAFRVARRETKQMSSVTSARMQKVATVHSYPLVNLNGVSLVTRAPGKLANYSAEKQKAAPEVSEIGFCCTKGRYTLPETLARVQGH